MVQGVVPETSGAGVRDGPAYDRLRRLTAAKGEGYAVGRGPRATRGDEQTHLPGVPRRRRVRHRDLPGPAGWVGATRVPRRCAHSDPGCRAWSGGHRSRGPAAVVTAAD